MAFCKGSSSGCLFKVEGFDKYFRCWYRFCGVALNDDNRFCSKASLEDWMLDCNREIACDSGRW